MSGCEPKVLHVVNMAQIDQNECGSFGSCTVLLWLTCGSDMANRWYNPDQSILYFSFYCCFSLYDCRRLKENMFYSFHSTHMKWTKCQSVFNINRKTSG